MTPSFFNICVNIIVVCHVQRRRDQRGMIARSSICLIVTAAAALAARRSHGARTAPLSAAFATQLRFARMRIAERDQYINATAGRKNGLASRSLASWYGGMVLSPSFACPVDLVKALSDRRRAQARATNHTADGGKWLCGLSLLGALGEPPTRRIAPFDQRTQLSGRQRPAPQVDRCDACMHSLGLGKSGEHVYRAREAAGRLSIEVVPPSEGYRAA